MNRPEASRVEAEPRRSVDREEWKQLVEQCGGNPMHLPEVHFTDHDPRDLLHLVFRRRDSALACATAFTVRRRVVGLTWGPRFLELPTVPAIRDDTDRAQVYSALLEYAAHAGYSRLILHPRWGDCFEGNDLFRDHLTRAIVEFVLDLRPGLGEILKRMHKVHRKNIRRAEAGGLTVEPDSTLAGLMRLREMQLVSAERAAEKGHGFGVSGGTFFRRAFAQVYSTGIGRILFAKRGQDYMAGLAYLVGGRRGLTVRSGSTADGYETRAMYLLHYELIKRSLDEGLLELNLGGVPRGAQESEHPQAGLYEFKKGFGGTPEVRTGVDMRIDPA